MSAVPAGRRPRPAPSTPVGTAAPSAAAERLAGLVGGVLLYAACAALSLWHVRLLSRPIIETRELVVLGALGLAPGLAAALAPRGRVRLLVAAIGLLALVAVVFGRARGRWPGWPLLGDDGYLQVVAGDVRDGLGEWVQTLLPYEVSVHPTIHLVVQLATVLLLAWVGLAVLVLREPVSAILAVFIPFATTSAVFRVEHEVVRTALAVGLALVLLAALRGRRPAPAAFGWAAVLVVAAVVLAGAPGVAKGAFLDWRSWSDIPREGRGVEFMWQPSYGPLQRPESRTTVARVRSDRSSYWRANVLTRFNGLRWEESPVGADAVRGVGAVVGSAASGAPWLGGDVEEAEITVSNLGFKDPDLLVPANGVPLSVTGVSRRAGGISLDVARGVATTDRDWPVGTEYRVRYAIVDPTPKQLNEAGDEYPDAIREDGLALSLLEDVEFPLFGVEGREDTVQSLFDFQFYDPRVRDWREAYGTARDVVADAKTPYEAVVALEEWFQQGTYDETADYSAAPNGPLPAFLLTPNRPGYCQMDAGAMAVLLRMLGIPARVAQGFTAGRADRERKRWTLTDAEAHAWVEVFFPGHGWVPFEPTPSRRLASAASGTSPRFAAGATDIAATSAALGALLARIGSSGGIGEGPGGPAGAPDLNRGGGLVGGAGASGGAGRLHVTFGAREAVLLGAVLLVALLAAVKRRRLLLARLADDPARRATLVRLDLVDWLRDQGMRGPVERLTTEELVAHVRRDFGADASAWATAHARARYGPPGAEARSAAARARDEAAAVKSAIRRDLRRGERIRGALDPRSLRPRPTAV